MIKDLLTRAMEGKTPAQPITDDEVRMIVLMLTEVEGKLDDAVERMYLSEHVLDAGQLMAAAATIAFVRKDLENDLPKVPDDEPTPDSCPSCGVSLVLKVADDPTGPAECPVCKFQAPAYPSRDRGATLDGGD